MNNEMHALKNKLQNKKQIISENKTSLIVTDNSKMMDFIFM